MNIRRIVLFVITVCILSTCVGCRTPRTLEFTYNPSVPQAPTLRCPVALELSPEFANYQYSLGLYQAPFGPALQKYATYVAQSEFGDVQVLDGQTPLSDVKLLLVPRVASLVIQTDVPGSGAIGVNWDFKDPKTRQTLYSMHVQCECQDPNILHLNPFDTDFNFRHFNYLVNGLMTNLTAITIQRFDASKDLQRLTGH
jgi:hypothetical protein